MKRLVSLCLAVVMVFGICACSGSDKEAVVQTRTEDTKNYLELTEDMIEEIEERISGEYYSQMICIIFLKQYPLDDYNYTDFEVKNSKKQDKYTYHVYGKLRVENNYSESTYIKAYLVYKATESDETDTGYKVVLADIVLEE